jgi:biotin carboxyl carrier protein
MTPDILEVEPGVFSVIRDGRSYEARVTPEGIQIEGRRIAVELHDPRAYRRQSGAAASGGRQNIAASMPGKIVRVLVAEGDEVQPGQGLIVVEAMKMQNEVKAAKAGRVTKVHVADGATVSAGQPLIAIES